jgi:hypothetical protein
MIALLSNNLDANGCDLKGTVTSVDLDSVSLAECRCHLIVAVIMSLS